MRRLTKSKRYAVLALLAVLAGCTLPAGGHRGEAVVGEPNSVVTVANPTQPSRASVAEPRPSSQAIPTTLQVSHQASADTATEPPIA
jgi:hypothetical protein